MCPDSIAWLIPSAVGFAGAIIGALVGAFAGYRYMLIHEFNTALRRFLRRVCRSQKPSWKENIRPETKKLSVSPLPCTNPRLRVLGSRFPRKDARLSMTPVRQYRRHRA